MRLIFVLFLLTICYCSCVSEKRVYSSQWILKSDSSEHSLIIRDKNKQIIYTGNFTNNHYQYPLGSQISYYSYMRDFSNDHYHYPVGTHIYYDNNGNIKQLIDYSFENIYSEEITIIQKSHIFDKDQKLEKIIEAKRGTKGKYSPTYTWKYFENGKLIKTIDTDEASNLEYKEYDIYLDLLEKTKQ